MEVAMFDATLGLIIRDQHILLGKKKRGKVGTGFLTPPGGVIEEGESPETCLIRETKEEWNVLLREETLRMSGLVTFFAGSSPYFKVRVFQTAHFEGQLTETEDFF